MVRNFDTFQLFKEGLLRSQFILENNLFLPDVARNQAEKALAFITTSSGDDTLVTFVHSQTTSDGSRG